MEVSKVIRKCVTIASLATLTVLELQGCAWSRPLSYAGAGGLN